MAHRPLSRLLSSLLARLIRRKTTVPTVSDDLSEEEFSKRLAALDQHISTQETVRQVESMAAYARSQQAALLSRPVSDVLPEPWTPLGDSREDAASPMPTGKQRLLLLPHKPTSH